MSFAKKLKEARMAKRLSREDFGEMVNKSARTVKSWELRQSKPSLDTRRKIERALGLPYGNLDNDYDPELCELLTEFNILVQAMKPSRRHHMIIALRSAIAILK